MGKMRLTKAIKDLIAKFKEEEFDEKHCTTSSFKTQLFSYLNSRNKKIHRNDVFRWCKTHAWILEDDSEWGTSGYHPRKRVNLPNATSTSYGGCNRRASSASQSRESREDEALQTTVCNETSSFKREVHTPRTSGENQGTQHLPSETRPTGNDIGQLGYNSDESTATVYRGQEEGRGGIVGQTGLPVTLSSNKANCNSDNGRGALSYRIVRPVPIYPSSQLLPDCSLSRAPIGQVEAVVSPLVPDSSCRMPSLSPQMPVTQIPTTSQRSQRPSSTVRNQPHIMDQELPSCSRNSNFNQPPPEESVSNYDASYLQTFHDAFVSVRQLTDLCVNCHYLRKGLLPLEEFTNLLSHVNKKVAMPKTYSEASRAQFPQFKKETVESHLNNGTDIETGTEDETEDNDVIETGRVTTTARNLFRKRKRFQQTPLINIED